MEVEEVINMRNEVHRFCVSWVTIRVIAPAILSFVHAWNAHRLPGRNGGVPNVLAARTRRICTLLPMQVLSTTEGVRLHEAAGGHLVRESTYGRDPLEHHTELQQLRQRDFFALYPSVESIFSDVLLNNGTLLKQAILLLFLSLRDLVN